MARNNGKGAAVAEAAGERLSMNGNGNGHHEGAIPIGSFSVWRRQTSQWNGIRNFRTNFRREMGSGARLFDGPSRRFFLITPDEGEIAIAQLKTPFSDVKDSLVQGASQLGRGFNLGVKGFSVSRPDEDGKKTVSLVLEGESLERSEEERSELLRGIGAGGLALSEIDPMIEIATIPADKTRRDVRPLMEKHLPEGTQISYSVPVVSMYPAVASV